MHSKQIDTEQQIWEYLDGTCDAATRALVEQQLLHNPDYKQLFVSVAALHEQLHTELTLEEPAMRFTRNVMDAVAGEKILKPARAYVNQWVIRGIAGVFIAVIGWMLARLLPTMSFTPGTTSLLREATDTLDFSFLQKGRLTNAMLCMTGVALVMLIDAIVGSRRQGHARSLH